MIRVTVELLSAVHPSRSRVLAMMDIANDGQRTLLDPSLGSYTGRTYVGRDRAALERGTVSRRGAVNNWPRDQHHVWNLVARMLEAMGYNAKARP
jgi:hypothetical protein